MTGRRNLRVVPADAAPAATGVDIAAQWRDEIKARDWTRVHLEGDRRSPIFILTRRWRWAAPGLRRSSRHD